jgi:hypothetical protein
MFIEYGTPRFIHDGGIDPTQTCDVRDDYLLTFDYYQEGTSIEYSSKHKDSMEVHLVELVHALAKKMRDVKRSYGKKIQQFSLELEHM